MNSSVPKKLTFKPRAELIRTIGDRLISGPEAVIIESVKNAHDADAAKVDIRFSPSLDNGEPKIVVLDDGHGMTLGDIQSRWMEPATTDKVERRHSPANRKLLGSKGIDGENRKLTPADWKCGEKKVLVDLVAPFGGRDEMLEDQGK